MAETARHIDLKLDPLQANRLSDLAARTRTDEVELAAMLLADALERTGGDGDHLTGILDAVPGARKRAEDSLRQAERGETVALSDL